LPPVSEVERIVQEQQDAIRQIEAVNPGLVGVEVNPCGAGEVRAVRQPFNDIIFMEWMKAYDQTD